MDKLVLLSGNSNKTLANHIAHELKVKEGMMSVGKFSDGEIRVKIQENVRGQDVFVVQSTCPPVNDNLMEMLVILDALRRASASRITVVLPYFGYARQDRKDQPRVPITAKLVANLLTVAGANRILTMDLHAGQVQGFFDIPVDNLYAIEVFVDYFKKVKKENDLVIVSPDVGGIKMARAYAKRFGAGLAIVDKRRNSPESTEVMHIMGEVKGKNVILVDDIIATGSSIVEASRALRSHGARKIWAAITHGILSNSAVEKLNDSEIDTLVITDSIPLPPEKRSKKIKVISVDRLIAEAIKRIHFEKSISVLFDSVTR